MSLLSQQHSPRYRQPEVRSREYAEANAECDRFREAHPSLTAVYVLINESGCLLLRVPHGNITFAATQRESGGLWEFMAFPDTVDYGGIRGDLKTMLAVVWHEIQNCSSLRQTMRLGNQYVVPWRETEKEEERDPGSQNPSCNEITHPMEEADARAICLSFFRAHNHYRISWDVQMSSDRFILLKVQNGNLHFNAWQEGSRDLFRYISSAGRDVLADLETVLKAIWADI